MFRTAKRGQVLVCVNPVNANDGQTPVQYGKKYIVLGTFEYGTQVSLKVVTNSWRGTKYWPHYAVSRFVSLSKFKAIQKAER